MKIKLTKEQKYYFEGVILNEKFKLLLVYKDMPVFDVEHVEERFAERFPQYSWQIFLDKLKKGLQKIDKKYKMNQDNYVIISHSKDIKIPIEIRPDRNDSSKTIGAVPTVLNKDEHTKNLKKEIEVMIEKTKEKGYGNVKLFEDKYSDIFFQYIIENGEVGQTFVEVDVD